MHGFARREFQLMLLRRMADYQPDLVEAALVELEVPHADYMAAHNRWQSMLHSKRAPAGLDLYQAVLGPADGRRTEKWGEVTLTAHAWRLPVLWPELTWEVMVGVGGVVLHGWLVRAHGYPPPDLPAPAHWAPWSCVVGDAMRRFPDARQIDPQVPSQWMVLLDDDQGQPWRLRFVHGLLQTVEK